MNEMEPTKAEEVFPEVEITAPSEDEIISGTYTISAEANDGEHGSGIDRVEFWAGQPDDTPDSWEGTGIMLCDYDDHDAAIEDTYECDWDVTKVDENGDPVFSNDKYTIYARAYDQSGNSKVSEGVEVKFFLMWLADGTPSGFYVPGEPIHYYVTYYNSLNRPPDYVRLMIAEETPEAPFTAYDMSPTGTDYVNGVQYIYDFPTDPENPITYWYRFEAKSGDNYDYWPRVDPVYEPISIGSSTEPAKP